MNDLDKFACMVMAGWDICVECIEQLTGCWAAGAG